MDPTVCPISNTIIDNLLFVTKINVFAWVGCVLDLGPSIQVYLREGSILGPLLFLFQQPYSFIALIFLT